MKNIFRFIFSIALAIITHSANAQVMFKTPVRKPIQLGESDSIRADNLGTYSPRQEKVPFVVTFMGQSLKSVEERATMPPATALQSHFKAVGTKTLVQSDSLVLMMLEDSLSKVRAHLRTFAYPQVTSPSNLLRSIPSILPIRIRSWADYKVSSGFGLRYHPVRGMVHNHAGIDLPQAKFSPVYATADAIVDRIVWQPEGLGLAIYLKHASGYQTAYGHLDDHSVLVGETVSRGQIIGHIGETGMTTGPHLHYSVLWGSQPVDPTEYCFLLMKTLQPARSTSTPVATSRKWKNKLKTPLPAPQTATPGNNTINFKELKLISLKPRFSPLPIKLMALSQRSLFVK